MLSHSAVLRLVRLIGQFAPVLALCDSFGVDVPLNFDIIIIIIPLLGLLSACTDGR